MAEAVSQIPSYHCTPLSMQSFRFKFVIIRPLALETPKMTFRNYGFTINNNKKIVRRCVKFPFVATQRTSQTGSVSQHLFNDTFDTEAIASNDRTIDA
jgi:hypothetical protein